MLALAIRFGFVLSILLCVGALRAVAAEPVEVVPGLTYLRITDYRADSAHFASALAANRPLVVDVRYPPADGAADFPFATILAQRAADTTTALFFLVSPATPKTFADALASLPRGAVTLGVADSRPTPGVVVAQPAETDRHAYDAWSEKIPLASLITGKIEKERFDEAALVKEFRHGASTAPTPPPVPDPTAKSDGEKVPVLTDRVLQRAVHLHRALLALRPRAA